MVEDRPLVSMGGIRRTQISFGMRLLGLGWFERRWSGPGSLGLGPLGLGVLGLCSLELVGCGRSKGQDATRGSETLPADTVGAAPAKGVKQGRCTRLAGAPALAVGSQAEPATDVEEEGASGEAEGPAPAGPLAGMAVEFARAAADDGTFLLGLLTLGQETRASVAILRAAGSARTLDLGRVEGEAEPPRVAASGGHWLALVTDHGPKGPTLRITGIAEREQKLETRLGPEIKKALRDPSGADVAVLASGRALVVWDRASAHGESELAGLSFDARTLREESAPVLLSQPGQAAFEPRLVAGAAGYHLLWLAEERNDAPASSGTGLLEEPPRVLFARELDEAGRPRGAPTRLSALESAPLVLDARILPSGSLLVAYRAAPADRPTDDQPIHLVTLAPGGAVKHHPVRGDELLGPGAPGLLGRTGADVSWLTLEDSGGTTQLARVLGDGSVQPTPVTGLLGHVALAGDPSRLLTAEPRGIGALLQILSCSLD